MPVEILYRVLKMNELNYHVKGQGKLFLNQFNFSRESLNFKSFNRPVSLFFHHILLHR